MSGSSTASIRLPWTGEFSPGQLKGERPLREALEVVAANEGDRAKLVEAIRVKWFAHSAGARSDPAERLMQQQKRAGNVIIGMRGYGLIDADCRFTTLGGELAVEIDDAVAAKRFAAHILKHCQGLELLDVVRDLQQRRVGVDKKRLTAELRRRGYSVTTNSGDEGKLRAWLGQAGVIDDNWVINEAKVAELAGTSLATIGEWQTLTRAQRAFIATVRRLAETRQSADSVT